MEAVWYVFPVAGKRPMIKEWQKRAVRADDGAAIAAWRTEFPNMTHLGVVCGTSGVVCIDTDMPKDADLEEQALNLQYKRRNGGARVVAGAVTGDDVWRSWCAGLGVDVDDEGTFPLVMRSPSGGTYYICSDSRRGLLRPWARVLPLVDIRAGMSFFRIGPGYSVVRGDLDIDLPTLPSVVEEALLAGGGAGGAVGVGSSGEVVNGRGGGGGGRELASLEALQRTGIPVGAQHEVLRGVSYREVGKMISRCGGANGVRDKVVDELMKVVEASPVGDAGRPWTRVDVAGLVDGAIRRHVERGTLREEQAVRSMVAGWRAERSGR